MIPFSCMYTIIYHCSESVWDSYCTVSMRMEPSWHCLLGIPIMMKGDRSISAQTALWASCFIITITTKRLILRVMTLHVLRMCSNAHSTCLILCSGIWAAVMTSDVCTKLLLRGGSAMNNKRGGSASCPGSIIIIIVYF